ncbi:MAG: hypothetical protein ACPGVB_02775 [Chitinophagales bacterium]
MNLSQIHENCHTIFRNNFFNKDEEYYGASNACRIYDKLTEDSPEKQDCIGENFNQLIHRINDEWFTNYTPGGNLDYYFFNYFLLLYLFVERVDLIFEVINPKGRQSKLFIDYQQHNFKTLRKINKWANFIKHPKEFLFTHWARYYIQGELNFSIKEGDIIINTDFIFKHYFSESKQRPVILENKNNVFVEVPKLEEITLGFCQEMNLFFDFICNNQIIADFLKKKSTIEEYFEYASEERTTA